MKSFRITLLPITQPDGSEWTMQDELNYVDDESEWDALEDGCDGCGAAPTHRVGRVLLCDTCTEPAPCQCPYCVSSYY